MLIFTVQGGHILEDDYILTLVCLSHYVGWSKDGRREAEWDEEVFPQASYPSWGIVSVVLTP